MEHIKFEGIWRPKYEIVPAVTGLVGAFAFALFPKFFTLDYITAPIFITSALLIGGWWLYQYLNIRKRHTNLVCNRFFRLSKAPHHDDKLYLGKGFVWQAKHRQAMHELNTSSNHFYRQLKKKSKATTSGDPRLHGVEVDEKDIYLSNRLRAGHTAVFGTTGCGKTRLIELLVSQDIARGDCPVIVIDPKGDQELLERIYHEAKKTGRLQDLYLMHLAHPEISSRYNPLGEFTKITEIASRIADQLPGSGQSAAFKQFAWNFLNNIAQVFYALGQMPTYSKLKQAANNTDTLLEEFFVFFLNKHHNGRQEEWEKPLKILQQRVFDPDDKAYFLPKELKSRDKRTAMLTLYINNNRETYLYDSDDKNSQLVKILLGMLQYDREYYSKLVASVVPFLEQVTTGKVGELFSPDLVAAGGKEKRPQFTWRSVIARNAIVYVGLDTMTDSIVGTAVGRAMFSALRSTLGSIYNHGQSNSPPEPENTDQQANKMIMIHIDEVNAICSPELTDLLNKGRGAGARLHIYTETIHDLTVGLENKDAAMQQVGNLNNVIFMRTPDPQTAQLLTNSLPEVQVASVTLKSAGKSSSDEYESADNQESITFIKTNLLQPSDLANLPEGEGFLRAADGEFSKVRFPLLEEIYYPDKKQLMKIAATNKTTHG